MKEEGDRHNKENGRSGSSRLLPGLTKFKLSGGSGGEKIARGIGYNGKRSTTPREECRITAKEKKYPVYYDGSVPVRFSQEWAESLRAKREEAPVSEKEEWRRFIGANPYWKQTKS